MKRKDGHLERLLRLEKSKSVHKKGGKSSYLFLRVYLSTVNVRNYFNLNLNGLLTINEWKKVHEHQYKMILR